VLRREVFLRRTKKKHSELVLEYTFGNLRFSFTNLKIYVAQQEISLSQREADLLKVFCQHPNKVLKREEVCSMYGVKMLTFHA
jgi:DNA-binding response OmpR family regulator